MQINVDTESPMESITQAVTLLTGDIDVEIEVECNRLFFQKLIDTKQLSKLYHYFVSTDEPIIRKCNAPLFRKFQYENILFFENIKLDHRNSTKASMYLKNNKDEKIELTI